MDAPYCEIRQPLEITTIIKPSREIPERDKNEIICVHKNEPVTINVNHVGHSNHSNDVGTIIQRENRRGRFARSASGIRNQDIDYDEILCDVEKGNAEESCEDEINSREINTIFCKPYVDLLQEPGEEIMDTQSVRCPEVNVKYNTIKIKALVDTGSQISCMSEEMCQVFIKNDPSIKILPVIGKCVIGATGKRSSRLTQQLFIECSVGEQPCNVIFVVVPGLVREMILGAEWMSENKVVINFKEKRMWINDNVIPQDEINFTSDNTPLGINCVIESQLPTHDAMVMTQLVTSHDEGGRNKLTNKQREILDETLEYNKDIFKDAYGLVDDATNENKGIYNVIRLKPYKKKENEEGKEIPEGEEDLDIPFDPGGIRC